MRESTRKDDVEEEIMEGEERGSSKGEEIEVGV